MVWCGVVQCMIGVVCIVKHCIVLSCVVLCWWCVWRCVSEYYTYLVWTYGIDYSMVCIRMAVHVLCMLLYGIMLCGGGGY